MACVALSVFSNLRALVPCRHSAEDRARIPNETFTQTLKAAIAPAIVLFLTAFAGSAVADNTVFLQSSTYTVSENAGSAAIVVQVTRAAGNQDEITVEYATTDGTAQHPSDYLITFGTITFEPNETARLVQVARRKRRLLSRSSTTT